MIGFGFLLTLLLLGAIFFALGDLLIYGLMFLSVLWIFTFSPQFVALLVIAAVLWKALRKKTL